MLDGLIRTAQSAGQPPRRAVPPPRIKKSGRVPLSRKRKKARAVFVLIVFLLAALFVGGLLWASFHPRINIQSIDVRGESKESPTEIEAAVWEVLHDDAFHVLSNSNIFAYPKNELVLTLEKQFPRLHSIELSRPDPFSQLLIVSIKERNAWSRWCSDDNACYAMDKDGFIFASTEEVVGYTFTGGLIPDESPIGQTYLYGNMTGVVSVLAYLEGKGHPALGVRVLGEKDYSIKLSSGLLLYVPFGVLPENIVKNFETALNSDALSGKLSDLYYIDLRYGNRVYYGFHPGEIDQGVMPIEESE